ncbi:MAG: hypothetical protein E6J68_00635 [Deltaproteobacteria bacterium]|nr:MAG: hypothetical protein E6J68_00635 [Deltaproteobacteria bacterium]TMA71205.1 MAG: hypothetical protein E6J69_00250 [Deltaproteobacteria bacterium]
MVDRFLELAIHVKLASEAVVEAAEQLPALRPDDPGSAAADAWSRLADEIMALNVQVGFMERLLRTVMRESAPAPSARVSGSH